MRSRYIFLFVIGCIPNLVAQNSDTLLNTLFYNLNLSQPRELICKTLRHNNKFSEILRPGEDTSQFGFEHDTYYGKVLHKGCIKNNPDSMHMQISHGFGIAGLNAHKPEQEGTHFKFSYVEFEYFFHSQDSLEKSCNAVIAIVHATNKNLDDTGLGPTSGGEVGTGKQYLYQSKPLRLPNLTILKMTLPGGKYSLRLRYEREGD